MTAINDKVKVYVDGSCLKTGGPGGWAWVAVDWEGRSFMEGSGGVPVATNNTMELTAAIEGVRAIETYAKSFAKALLGAPVRHVFIVSDSQYVTRGMTEWWDGWERRGFHKVKNLEYWRTLKGVADGCAHELGWRWVKGHAGNPHNEQADKLAGLASAAYKMGVVMSDA